MNRATTSAATVLAAAVLLATATGPDPAVAGEATPTPAPGKPPAARSIEANLGGSGATATFDVRSHGAVGDGETLDRTAIQRAVDACADAGGGVVRFPPGRYLTGTVRLRSHVTLKLDVGARLVGTRDLDAYESYHPPAGTPEARFGSRWHRALVLAVEVTDVAIVGPGTIDGNRVFDPRGEERQRGPHTILVGSSRRVTIRDLEMIDSANYAVMIEFSSEVDVGRVRITGGWDGVHFRGWKDRPCRDLSIVGCQLFTGDDAIAGRYAEDLLVAGCVVNSSCNGVRIIGPGRRLIFHDCLFYGPGRRPHRTSDRRNMLSGIILQPGGWDACEGPLEGVLVSHVTMRDVKSPVTIILKRDGNTVKNVTVSRLTATGVYGAAASVESWTETPVGRVVFRDVSIEYAGGGEAKEAARPARPPGVDARALPAWGLFARHAREIILEDVRLTCEAPDRRPVVIAERVERLVLDEVRFPRPEDAGAPIVLRDVERVEGSSAPEEAP